MHKYNTYKLEVKNWDNLLMISNYIYESGLVKYCHPNFVSEIVRYQEDPLYTDQYYLNNTGQLEGTHGIDINAPEAWQLSMGLLTTRVAVIDDGVENHEDFNGRVLQGFTPTNATGFGAPTNNLPPDDLYIFGHGEACAGIIASTHNNIGIAGISPSTQIVPVNIFNNWFIHTDSHGNRSVRFNETAEDLATAIDWAWDEGGADVLSNSWGYSTTSILSDEIVQAINRARTQGRNTLGSVVVFASGNSHQSFSGVSFPANVDGVVTVGAIDNSGNIWNYSSRGAEMDLVAPSGDVNLDGNLRTTDRMGDDGYDLGNYMTNFGGTSAACPQVAGVVALMLSTNGNLTETEVVSVLRNTATDMGNSGFDNNFGYGRLNAFRAIQEILPTIVGSDLVCSSGSTYNINNLLSGTSATWTSSSNISFLSGNTGGTVTAKAYSSISSGSGWIEATINGACGDVTLPRKNVWVGNPSFTLSGTTSMDVGMPGIAFVNYSHGDHFFQGVQSSDWSFTGPLDNIDGGAMKARYKASRREGGIGFIYSTQTNQCGSTENGLFFEVDEPFFMLASPNPANEYTELNFYSENELSNYQKETMVSVPINEESQDLGEYEIQIWHERKGLVKQLKSKSKKLQIPTNNLDEGTYFLHVIVNGKVHKQQLKIQR